MSLIARHVPPVSASDPSVLLELGTFLMPGHERIGVMLRLSLTGTSRPPAWTLPRDAGRGGCRGRRWHTWHTCARRLVAPPPSPAPRFPDAHAFAVLAASWSVRLHLSPGRAQVFSTIRRYFHKKTFSPAHSVHTNETHGISASLSELLMLSGVLGLRALKPEPAPLGSSPEQAARALRAFLRPCDKTKPRAC